MKYTIYIITDTTDGTVYVGVTTTKLSARFGRHRRALKKSVHWNEALQAAWDLHPDKFIIQQIDEAENRREAYDIEMEWVRAFPSVFNVVGTEEHSKRVSAQQTGMVRSEEFKETLRERFKDPALRLQCGAANKGRKLSDEHKATLSAAIAGRKMSDEARAAMSAGRQRYLATRKLLLSGQ